AIQYTQVLGQHREKIDFRYYNIGKFEIMYRHGLYYELLEKLQDILYLDEIKKRRKLQQKSKDPFHSHCNPNGSKDQAKEFSGFLILSSREIYNVALWAEQYYKLGKHYFFMRSFLGTAAWSHIDYDSVVQIIDKICRDKSDLGNQSKWYKLLSDAYTRISDGIRTEGRYALIRILKGAFS
ncbi:MAG: hypothetical protein WBZ36_24510, partial [Candidatus Nitrosopolaris sp.]